MSEIFYASVPEFYAAVEMADDPELATRPIVVGGAPEKGGRVQSANELAKRAGAAVGMPVAETLARVPGLAAVRTDMKRYRQAAEALRSCLWRDVRILESEPLSGFYFLRSAVVARPAEHREAAEDVALRLIERVRMTMGLELQIGVAEAKFVARLAAEECGETRILCVPAAQQSDFLAPLPVERLPNVGPKMRATLKSELGVATIAELREVDPDRLESTFGNHGLRVLELAHGRDPAVVRGSGPPKSLSAVQSFGVPTDDGETIGEALVQLSRSVEDKLRLHALQARCVGVKIQLGPSRGTDRLNRSHTLPRSIDQADAILRIAAHLLETARTDDRPIRRLSLSVSKLHLAEASDRQLELFESDS